MSSRRPLARWSCLPLALAVVAWLGGRGRGSAAWLGDWRLELFDGDGALALVVALSLAVVRSPALGTLAGALVLLLGVLGVWDLLAVPTLPELWPRASGAALGVVLVLAAAHLRGAWRVASRPREGALAVTALLAGFVLSSSLGRIDHATRVRRLAEARPRALATAGLPPEAALADAPAGATGGSAAAPDAADGSSTADAAPAAPGPTTTPGSHADAATAPVRRDLLLIVVDTLRADATAGLPVLESLRSRSLVLEDTWAPAPWTVPSVAALMTGHYPARLDPHGRGAPWARPADRPARLLPDGAATLAERLARAGYLTAGLTKSPFLEAGTGFERGFAVYERVPGDTAEDHSAGQLVDASLRWASALADLRRRGDRRPWFLSLHFMDPHVNYQPPAEHLPAGAATYDGPFDGRASTLHEAFRAERLPGADDLDHLRGLYAGEVAYLDEQLGRLLEGLQRRGLLDAETLVVLTADHGEQFGEHGGFLHGNLHDENLAVPLWLSGPGLEPGSRPGPHSLVDLVPTLLDLLGLPGGQQLDGVSALAAPGDRLVLTDYGDQRRVSGPRFSLQLDGDGHARLHDRQADPGATTNLAGRHPELVDELRRLVEQHLARPAVGQARDGPPVELDLGTLRRLGYF